MRWTVLALITLLGCDDAGEADGTTTSGSPAGTGGNGQGGGGPGGGGPGGGGQGGAGGATPTCLPASTTTPHFTIARTDLCAVAVYAAPDLELVPYGAAPTWGSHGGPLTFSAVPATATITRWSVNAGALTFADTTVALTGVPADAYFGAQIVDVEVDATKTVSAFGWTGASFLTEGELVLVDGATSQGYLATGVFGLGAVSGRALYTGLSALEGATSNVPGLYAAAASQVSGVASLADDGLVHAWGLATGPVAADANGNVISVMTDYLTGYQEVRAYAAATIGPGQPATAGAVIATLGGFGSALAAMAEADGEPGIAFFQPNDATTSDYLDALAIEYVVTAGVPSVVGTPTDALTLTTANTNLSLMTDPSGRLWVGAPNTAGGSVFYVLARVE